MLIISSTFTIAKTVDRQIIPMDQVEKGMTGIGKTVISGTKIEEFEVKVLDILKNQKVNQDLILVKVSGDLIEETGGIAAGMSGSPVYIDGKLIGAIGYGWQLSDHKIGMVTPIQEMLKVWELGQIEQNSVANLDETVKVGERKIDKVKFIKDKPGQRKNSRDTLVAYPAQTPLLVNGLGQKALDYLNKELTGHNVKPIQAGGTVSDPEQANDKLAPGSAMAVQLVRGDIDMSAIGTLTYREGNRILGLGHRFMAKGDSDYFLSSAYIHQMIKNLKMPFKLGSPLNLKGIVTQDRPAGVGGKTGVFPKVVPLQVTVNDQDLNRKRQIDVQLIRDEDLIQSLAGSVVYQAINSTIKRQGGGTAEVEMEIMANSLEDNIIKRKNIFYSQRDVASVALNDFLEGLTLITQNPFQKINLIDINLDVKVKEKPQVALIEEMNFSQKEVKPGEELELRVKLRPYREEPIEKKYSFKLPEDIEPGSAIVELIGGREANFTKQKEVEAKETEYGHGENQKFKSLEEVLNAFKEQKINSDLVVKIIPNYNKKAMPVNGDGNSESAKAKAKQTKMPPHSSEKDPKPVSNEFQNSFATDYILEGRVNAEIKIKPSNEDEDKTNEGKTKKN